MNWLIVISVFAFASLLFNIFLIWYCFKLIRELVEVSSTLDSLFTDIKIFANHLGAVYELETFYGDQTLENLLSHAKALTEEFDKYQSLFEITQEGQDDGEADQETPQAQE